jgi:predicted amidohydrolase YtcJ
MATMNHSVIRGPAAALHRPIAGCDAIAGAALATLAALALAAATLAGAAPAAPDALKPRSAMIADQILINGAVYTENPAQPWAEAVAILDGKTLAVGTTAKIRALAGPRTRITDLEGRMMMPGLIDDHVHAVQGAIGQLYDCIFASSATPEEIRKTLIGCVRNAPAGAWINGGYWDSNFFKHHSIPSSPRGWLDEVTGDRPLILRDDTGHNVWVNSAALNAAGVNSRTPDPLGGRFEREAGATMPNGVAYEAAADLLQKAVTPRTADQLSKAVARVRELAHSFGIIGLKEADATTPEIAAYTSADLKGHLDLYVAACISTLQSQDRPDKILDFNAIDKIHATYRSAHVATDFVKIYLDGVPTPARTAAMIEPYVADSKGGRVRGDFHVDPSVLAKDVVELDRRGYTVKMHAAGDRAIREGLDAIEAARRANPSGTLRHELAHAGFIAPEDLPRFAKLHAVADFSPVIWYPSPIIDAVIEAVGERGRHYWPMRTLAASGAAMAAGSDWPSVVLTMDPWGGIEAMVTRSDPYHASTKTLWLEESVDLATALKIYTLGGAAGLKRESQTGSIVAGKSADFIVLDRKLFKIPPSEISDTRVLMTYFQGKLVYRSKATEAGEREN